MAEVDHRKEAQDYARLAMTGNYVNEAYPQRLLMVAQVHATLTIAEAISELAGVIADRFSA